MKKIALLTLIIASLVSLVACYPFGSDGSWDKEGNSTAVTNQTSVPPVPTVVTANGTTAAVIMDGFAFTPTTLIVNKGTTVTWTNKYPVAHQVVADKNEFASGVLSTGRYFSWTFTESGNYTYHCANHAAMNGTIVVK